MQGKRALTSGRNKFKVMGYRGVINYGIRDHGLNIEGFDEEQGVFGSITERSVEF